MNTSLINTNITKKESIAALILLGWKQVCINLLIKPHTFKLDISIVVLEDNDFVFITSIQNTIMDQDTVVLSEDKKHHLTYSPFTILQVVMDNTNGNIDKNK